VTDAAVATSLTSGAERERGTQVPVIRRLLCIFRRRILVIAAPREAKPVTRHVERHFTSWDTVRDIVIGMSDGLTVPFARAIS
jgi:hypothetical protein